MKLIQEPPSQPLSIVFVGQNNRGDWVAREKHGLFGGLFINCDEAVRYALFENGHRQEAIVRVKALELDF